MTRKSYTRGPGPAADPFRERSPPLVRKSLQLLGGRFQFESTSRELLRLVDWAYADVPRHRLSTVSPRLRVRLLLTSGARVASRGEPPPLEMFSGAGLLGGTTASSSFVVLSPDARSALVTVSPQMLRSAYLTRYELVEFAVVTLAARTQGLVPLHAACVGRGGRGVLLMGESGSGKSTAALHCLLQGLDFLSEDSVFVTPDSLRATGVANFLHVRSDSLRWLEKPRDVAMIRSSPIIRRRSGVKKFEVDLRRGRHRLAAAPLKIVAVVFLVAQSAGKRPLLTSLPESDVRARLAANQPYAAGQPRWSTFARSLSEAGGFELRRGRHPLEAVEALEELLGADGVGREE